MLVPPGTLFSEAGVHSPVCLVPQPAALDAATELSGENSLSLLLSEAALLIENRFGSAFVSGAKI